MHGAIILDKAEGISSHGAVVEVRRLLGERRIGHLGTLDPFASGVLVLLLGKATRLGRFLGQLDKSYTGLIRLGYATDTYDRTGQASSPEHKLEAGAGDIRRELEAFQGTHLQMPPPISAKHVGGVRAYRLARKGREVSLQAVPVTIHEIEMLSLEGSLVGFRTRVSAGTYIRSLAHDLGQRLGCGAHLESLRRTAVAGFHESEAVRYEDLKRLSGEGTIPLLDAEHLLPEIPSLVLTEESARSAAHGNAVAAEGAGRLLKLLDPSGDLIAIAERDGADSYHPVVVLAGE